MIEMEHREVSTYVEECLNVQTTQSEHVHAINQHLGKSQSHPIEGERKLKFPKTRTDFGS